MKQQASAIELQQQLNELLAGIVTNLDSKKDTPLSQGDLFTQLKQSVCDLQKKCGVMQKQLEQKEKVIERKDQMLSDKTIEIDRLHQQNEIDQQHNASMLKIKVRKLENNQKQLQEEKEKSQALENRVDLLEQKLTAGKEKYESARQKIRELKQS